MHALGWAIPDNGETGLSMLSSWLIYPAPAGAGPLAPTVLTAGAALFIGLVIACLSRRLPAGIGAGAVIAAVSGAAILLFARDLEGGYSPTVLVHVLCGLTALWYVVGWIGSRTTRAARSASDKKTTGSSVKSTARTEGNVWEHAALFCGLAALGLLLRWHDGPLISRFVGMLDFLALLVFAELIWGTRSGAWTPYPLAVLIACLLVSFVPSWVRQLEPAPGGWGLVLIGVLCLASVLVTVLDDWRQRRRMWLREPHVPPPPLAPPRWLFCGIVAVCLCVGAGGFVFYTHPATAFALWFSAIACFVVGHVLRHDRCGEIGLILTGDGIVTAATAWSSDVLSGSVIGFVIAGGYLIWLARFWNQQLDAGKAWTTAGRLIPSARRLGYTAILGAFPAVLFIVGRQDAGEHLYLDIFASVVLLLAICLILKDHGQQGHASAAIVVCVLVIVAGVSLTRVIAAAAGMPISYMLGGALALIWLTALTWRRSSVAGEESYNAMLSGAGPMALLIVLSEVGFSASMLAAFGIVVLAGGVRAWRQGYLTVGGEVSR